MIHTQMFHIARCWNMVQKWGLPALENLKSKSYASPICAIWKVCCSHHVSFWSLRIRLLCYETTTFLLVWSPRKITNPLRNYTKFPNVYETYCCCPIFFTSKVKLKQDVASYYVNIEPNPKGPAASTHFKLYYFLFLPLKHCKAWPCTCSEELNWLIWALRFYVREEPVVSCRWTDRLNSGLHEIYRSS